MLFLVTMLMESDREWWEMMEKGWAHDGTYKNIIENGGKLLEMMDKWWEHDGTWQKNDETMVGNMMENDEKHDGQVVMDKWWEHDGEMLETWLEHEGKWSRTFLEKLDMLNCWSYLVAFDPDTCFGVMFGLVSRYWYVYFRLPWCSYISGTFFVLLGVIERREWGAAAPQWQRGGLDGQPPQSITGEFFIWGQTFLKHIQNFEFGHGWLVATRDYCSSQHFLPESSFR